MRYLPSSTLLLASILCNSALSFTIPPKLDINTGLKIERSRDDGRSQAVHTSIHAIPPSSDDRRAFLLDTIATVSCGICATILLPDNAFAMSGVTVAEFEILVRDSAKSIKSVVFSGPKGETAVVTLADDTQFAITDLIESSIDPRSPLKLAATCRLNNVPTKFSTYEDAVRSASPGSKKKKVYMNKRIQRADQLNKEKKIRMAQDEVERLEELERISQSQTERDAQEKIRMAKDEAKRLEASEPISQSQTEPITQESKEVPVQD